MDTFDIACLICEKPSWRLVRDHDHKTGKIRGLLCERCNSYLGVVEWKRKSNRKQRLWAEQYVSQITAHLKRDTGIVYDPHNRTTTIAPVAAMARLEHKITELEAKLRKTLTRE